MPEIRLSKLDHLEETVRRADVGTIAPTPFCDAPPARRPPVNTPAKSQIQQALYIPRYSFRVEFVCDVMCKGVVFFLFHFINFLYLSMLCYVFYPRQKHFVTRRVEKNT